MQSGSSPSMVMGDNMMSCAAPMPFGVMMTGQAGRWMISYQFMFEDMDGSRSGMDEISVSQILKRFPMAPTDMTMRMHMLMAMYAPTDKLTLSAMLPFVRKEMGNVMVDGSHFVERTDGIGDVELRAAYSVFQTSDHRHQLLLNGGLGLPTGSIDETMDGFQLEYCMQPGSGTVSLLPGLTYLGQAMPWGWGADFNPIVRVGRNDRGWRLGNRYETRAWGARQITSFVSLWAGLSGAYWGDVHGSDPGLDPTSEQTADPNLYAGKTLNALCGLTVRPPIKPLKGQQVFVEAKVPLVQSLDGPQLQDSWTISAAWQWEF